MKEPTDTLIGWQRCEPRLDINDGETTETMWFPERPIWECGACRRDIPTEFIWRSRGSLISRARRRRVRTVILRACCPYCNIRQSLCVEGAWWRTRLFYLLWRLRYPRYDPGPARPPSELHPAA